MSQPPPYTQQPYPAGQYNPQHQNPYYQPQQGGYYPAPNQGGYAQGQPGYYPNQPQVVYVEREPQRREDDCWLWSILALCCGCLMGEVCCDSPMLCCIIPCPIRLPRFGR